jgi:hypothetical protein
MSPPSLRLRRTLDSNFIKSRISGYECRQKPKQLPTAAPGAGRLLTAEAFQRLANIPLEIEWFANLGNGQTRRAHENAIKDFMRFTGMARPGRIPQRRTRACDRLAR